jgi:aryl-alcohol dehydrogenase-like predicted oxidoreductase
MQTTTLGMTGLTVSRICFGTWQLGGDWGSFDEQKAIDAIRHARELGINFFDTAQAYGFGASERLLGAALADDLAHRRHEVVIATKGGLRIDPERGLVRDSSPEWLRKGVDSSLRELGVDRIDLYQVHWPDPQVPFRETAEALQELVEQGKIAHAGVSNFSPAQMDELAATRPVETVQPPYHLFSREAERDVLPYAREHDIGVLIYGPLAHGLLTGAYDESATFPEDDWRRGSPLFQGQALRRNVAVVRDLAQLASARGIEVSQLAIAWTLANPAVHVAIVGARSRSHIAAAVQAADVALGDADLAEIDRIMESAVAAPGPSPESV